MLRLAFDTLLGQLVGLSHQQRTALLEAVRTIGRQDEVVATSVQRTLASLPCQRPATLPLQALRHNLQRAQRHPAGAPAPQGQTAGLLRHHARAGHHRQARGPVGARAQEHQLSLAPPPAHLGPARPATALRGIVEADEMFFLESEKGARALTRAPRKRGGVASKRGISGQQVCVLVARDRSGRTHDAVTGHAAYRQFASAAGIRHAFVNLRAGEPVHGTVHVQNVNGYHSRLRAWMHHFRGVATRYLGNYCGWRRAIDLQRINSAAAMPRSAIGVFNSKCEQRQKKGPAPVTMQAKMESVQNDRTRPSCQCFITRL
jgi:hypothetical protein